MKKSNLAISFINLNPRRLGHLDVILPLFLKLSVVHPRAKFFIILDNLELLRALEDNKFLYFISQNIPVDFKVFKVSKLKFLSRPYFLLASMIFLFIRRFHGRVAFFKFKSISSLLGWISSNISGFTQYMYLGAVSGLFEEYHRFYKPSGEMRNLEAEHLRSLASISSGRSGPVLVNSWRAIPYLNKKGYKKFLNIGFPYQDKQFLRIANIYRKKKSDQYENTKCYSIFVNKYSGRWAGQQTESWAVSRLSEIVSVVKQVDCEASVVVRFHPTISLDRANEILIRSGLTNKNLSYEHPFILGLTSESVISISQGSACIPVLAAGCRHIDYWRPNSTLDGIFETGSMYEGYGSILVETASDLQDLLEGDTRWRYVAKPNFMDEKLSRIDEIGSVS